MEDDLTYEDYKRLVDIRTLLQDAGYHFNRRDGLRNPAFIRLNSDGTHVKGDKFIVTSNGFCCFKPPEQRNYNVVSFIKEHPELFSEYHYGMNKDKLVNMVCRRLLGRAPELEWVNSGRSSQSERFSLSDYEILRYDPEEKDNYRKFFRYFRQRGIDLPTQAAFSSYLWLSTYLRRSDGKRFTNISFPFRSPSSDDVIGLEVRSLKHRDGTSYKGKALGTDSVNGMWIANLSGRPLAEARHVCWFESAFDAMSFYQVIHRELRHVYAVIKDDYESARCTPKEAMEMRRRARDLKNDLEHAVFVSTGGNPTERQFKGMIEACPNAKHGLGFDNDKAGNLYSCDFMMHKAGRTFNSYTLDNGPLVFIDRTNGSSRHEFDIRGFDFDTFCREMGLEDESVIRISPDKGFKDWNDQLLGRRMDIAREATESEDKTEEERTGLHL